VIEKFSAETIASKVPGKISFTTDASVDRVKGKEELVYPRCIHRKSCLDLRSIERLYLAVAFEELSPDAPSVGPQLEDAIEYIQDWVCRYDWTDALRIWEDFHNAPSDSEDSTKNRRLSPLGGDITFRVTCKVRGAAKGIMILTRLSAIGHKD